MGKFRNTELHNVILFELYYGKHTKKNMTGNLFVAHMKYRVIHKSLRDFRTRLRNNQDRHGRKEHINR